MIDSTALLKPPSSAADPQLQADCESCCGLCCVVLTLNKSADFALDKPADTPCPNLSPAFQCTIHQELRAKGFPGCVAFDCYGAGQKVTQHTFAGRNWQDDPESLPAMSRVFRVMWQLHLSLRYLAEALQLEAAAPLHREVKSLIDRISATTLKSQEELMAIDVPAHKKTVNALLWRVSEIVRAADTQG